MKHMESLWSTQETWFALGCASSNCHAVIVLSKLPACFVSRCNDEWDLWFSKLKKAIILSSRNVNVLSPGDLKFNWFYDYYLLRFWWKSKPDRSKKERRISISLMKCFRRHFVKGITCKLYLQNVIVTQW